MTLAVADQYGTAWTYEATRGKAIATERLNASAPIMNSTLSSDGARLITVDRDSTIAIWDLERSWRLQDLLHYRLP